MKKQIGIDIDVNRAIEAERKDFDETPNDILRRHFRIGLGKIAEVEEVSRGSSVRHPRRGGDYSVKLLKEKVAGGSLKVILKGVLLQMEHEQAGFLDKLARHRTSRGRRIVARKPEELYPGKPQLVKASAESLNPRWWYDTNVSFNQTQRYLNVIAELGQLDDKLVLQKS